MKQFVRAFFFSLVLFSAAVSFGQGQVRQKIAIFTPLYLDSVFSGGSAYRYGNTFPRFVNPGLEFYQGAQMALDSLQKAGAPLDVYVYDSRASNYPLAQRLASPELQDVNMFIANASVTELKVLADAALRKKVPLISTTLPNDAGVSANPYLVILNSTLRAHCEGIYQYLQKYHSRDKIVIFQKNGTQEDQIRDFLKETAQTATAPALALEFKNIGTGIDTYNLGASLDSTRNTVCIAGSLDENFGVRLAQGLASLRNTYPVTIIGMPTWENIREFTKPDYKDIEVVYTTPFYYARLNSLGNKISNAFEAQTSGRPSDMFYRGYESTLRFALLLLDTQKDVASNLTRKGNYIFTNFDIQPVFLNKRNMTLDYFENKKLFFVKTLNGSKTVL